MSPILAPITGKTATPQPKHRWLFGSAVLIAVSASGCIAVPTPEFNSGKARTNIAAETPRQFELGKTTRIDVILALGEPDAVSSDELKLAYRTEKVRGWLFIYNADGPITKDLYLVAEFDANGVLQRFEYSSSWFGSDDANKILPSVSTTNEKSIRLQKTAYWLPGVDGYKSWRFWQKPNEKRMAGELLLTDTDLQFIGKDQFANTDPELILPFHMVIEVGTSEFGRSRRLVVQTREGKIHSFEIAKGIFSNKEGLQQVVEFLQVKIKH